MLAYNYGQERAWKRFALFALIALGVACRKNADIPTAAARTLCDRRNRPEGAITLPDECRPFYELMQMAKLVPRMRAVAFQSTCRCASPSRYSRSWWKSRPSPRRRRCSRRCPAT